MRTGTTGAKLAALALAGAFILGACGGDDEPEAAVEGPQMDSSEETLISYVEEFQEAFLTEKGAGTYPTLSAECQAEWSQEEWADNAAAWTDLTQAVANVPASEIQIVDIQVREFSDTEATLTFKIADATGEIIVDDSGAPIANEERKWIHENGGWRTTECVSVAEAVIGG